jgi:sec-independent protein translocase protein TatB
MMELGFSELLLIGLIALLVVGPKRLPELARQAGSWIGKARGFVSNVRAEVEREFQAEELKRMLSEQQDEIRTLKDMISETQVEVEAETERNEHRSKLTQEQTPQGTRQSQADNTKDLPDSTATGDTKTQNDARRSSRPTQPS